MATSKAALAAQAVAAQQLSAALEWQASHERLQEAKADEAAKRAAAIESCFALKLGAGTHRTNLDRGYILKAVVRPKPNISAEQLAPAMKRLRAIGEAASLIADRLIKWTPELSISEWKKMTDKQRKLFARAVTVGASTPSLELQAPE